MTDQTISSFGDAVPPSQEAASLVVASAANPQVKAAPIGPRPRVEEPPGPKIWLVSFTDIMALMLTFFVMTYATTDADREDYKSIANALNRELGSFSGPPMQMGAYDTITLPRAQNKSGLDLGYLMRLVENKKTEDPLLSPIKVQPWRGDLMMTLPLRSLYSSIEKSQEITPTGQERLKSLITLMKGMPNHLELFVDPVAPDGRARLQALVRAQTIIQNMHNLGYDTQKFAGIRYLPATDASAEGPALNILVTRYQTLATDHP